MHLKLAYNCFTKVGAILELDITFKAEAPLRQGDILGFWDWSTKAPLDRFGIIITPDCDIAQGSPTQSLLYLRIITQTDFIRTIWARRKLEKLDKKNLLDLVGIINRIRSNAGQIELTPEEISLWVGRAPVDEIAAALNADATDTKQLQRATERLIKSQSARNTPAGSDCIGILSTIRDVPIEKIYQEAKNECAKPRDELFFLSGIKDIDDRLGYYVLLDSINIVRRDQISNSMYSVRHGEKIAYRFGSLTHQFKYAVAQRFSFLFQRIGLPDQHRALHTAALERLSTGATQSKELE
jgi:hypothetical protein